MFKFIFSTFLFLSVLHSFHAGELTYNSLAASKFTDHVQAFRCLFKHKKIDNFLEFGVGRGTKYFIDNCGHVKSFEIWVESRADRILPWFHKSIKAFEKEDNWEYTSYKGSETLDLFNNPDQAVKLGGYSKEYSDELLNEIEFICTEALGQQHYDAAFVDPGIVTRASIVQSLFNKVNIIIGHDTKWDIYGWSTIKVPENYEVIQFKKGCWTTLWINKSEKELIENLRKELK